MNFRCNKLIFFVVVGIALWAGGCKNPFKPAMTKDKAINTAASTPEQVLYNLQDAYNTLDIDLYKTCLADSFRFVLVSTEYSDIGVDMDGDGLKDNWWGYSQEIKYHENLFGKGSSDSRYPAPYKINLTMQIPTNSSWLKSHEEGLEDVIIIPCFFDLRLFFYDRPEIISQGYASFYLMPENGVWKILRWQDESQI